MPVFKGTYKQTILLEKFATFINEFSLKRLIRENKKK